MLSRITSNCECILFGSSELVDVVPQREVLRSYIHRYKSNRSRIDAAHEVYRIHMAAMDIFDPTTTKDRN
jgi:hypothetical protein